MKQSRARYISQLLLMNLRVLGLILVVTHHPFANAVDASRPTQLSWINTPPANMNSAPFNGLAKGLGSCVASPWQQAVNQAIQGVQSAVSGAGASSAITAASQLAGSSCGGVSDELPKIECSMVNSAKGVKDVRKELEKELQAYTCRLNKLELARKELTCLKDKSTELQSQLGILTTAMTTPMAEDQKQAALFKEALEDLQLQSADVKAKLGGDEATGQVGLLKLENQLKEAIGKFPSEYAGLKAGIADLKKQKAVMKRLEDIRTMSLAAECFRAKPIAELDCKSSAGGKFSPPPAIAQLNGKANVTVQDYILCRAYENSHTYRGPDGKTYRSDTEETNAKAKQNVAGLQTLLAEIFGSGPVGKAAPVSDEETKAALDQSNGSILSYDELYGSSRSEKGKSLEARLKAYDKVVGSPISGYVKQQFNSCYQNSKAQVTKEKSSAGAGGGVRQRKEAVDIAETGIKGSLESFMKNTTDLYSQAVRELNLNHTPINTSSCMAKDLDTQLACVQSAQQMVSMLYRGEADNTKTSLIVQGKGTKTVVSCADAATGIGGGIRGCTAAMQRYAKQLQTNTGIVDTARKKHAQAANARTDQFMTAIRNQFNTVSKNLETHLAGINDMLSSLNVAGVNFSPYPAGKLEVDPETGLYKAPDPPATYADVLLGGTAPPMMKVDGQNLTEVLGEIGKEANDLGKGKTQLENLISSGLPAEIARCAKERVEPTVNELQDLLTDLSTSCAEVMHCGDSDKAQDLVETIGEITLKASGSDGGLILDSNLFSGLDGAAAGACVGEVSSVDVTNISSTKSGLQLKLDEYKGCIDRTTAPVDGETPAQANEKYLMSERVCKNTGLDDSEYKIKIDELNTAQKNLTACRAKFNATKSKTDTLRNQVDSTSSIAGDAD